MTILDKHRTQKKVPEENVPTNGNATQEEDSEKQPRMRTRSSIAKKTIGETLDKVFEPNKSQKTNESLKRKKHEEKPTEQEKTVLDIASNTEHQNEYPEEDSCGMNNDKNLNKSTDDNKGKKKEKKNKKSKIITNDDKNKMDAEKKKPNTRSTTG